MTQADTNTTTQEAVQPTQQESTPLERAIAADTRQVIELTAEQAYDQLEVFGEAGTYKEGSPVQGNYYRFKFRGAIVIVSPEFKKAYDEGTMLGVTATPTVFTQVRPDPNNEGKTKEVVGYGWSLSFTDLAKKKKAQAARNAVRDLQITDQLQELKMQKKLEKIKSTDFKIEISDEEMQELIDAI